MSVLMGTKPAIVFFAIFFTGIVMLAGDPFQTEVAFIKNRKRVPDVIYQNELRHSTSWQSFLKKHGTWYVLYNEETGKPHRAFGQPIAVAGASVNERAINFIKNELAGFGISLNDLSLRKSGGANKTSKKYDQVNFTQYFQGLKVETSRLTIKMDKNGRVAMWGADIYDNIQVSTEPKITDEAAAAIAANGIGGVTGTTVSSRLSILPVPGYKSADFHLVYTVYVNATEDRIPGKYYSLVDAHTGELLYRQNQVRSHDGKSKPPLLNNLEVFGDVSLDNPVIQAAKMGFPNLAVNIDGANFYTDQDGRLSFEMVSVGAMSVSLSGKWVEVHNLSKGGLVPALTVTAVTGNNSIDLGSIATLEERSAYYNTNLIHDYQKMWLSDFSGADKQFPVNVDITPATCNAFYDGESINFFQGLNNCYSLALLADVVFHEYGHAINHEFYLSEGGYFNNGAMHEGYADVWAFAVYHDPILGNGMNPLKPDEFIRRYDGEPKIYPNDIEGEAHFDGEIIAGAWWDIYKNLGENMNQTMQLFGEAYPGLQAEAFDGNEGIAFTDVLLDVLLADDNDADLSNGTPNGLAIASAFKRHGITLISNAEIIHTPLEAAEAENEITVSAQVILDYRFEDYLQGMYLFYSVNNSRDWTPLVMNTGGNQEYQVNIPGMAGGTLLKYYLGVKDNLGTFGAVLPLAANSEDPNLPNFLLVGFEPQKVDDFDEHYGQFAGWSEKAPDDNATTGMWERAMPIGSFFNPSDQSTVIAPYYQTTANGQYCYVTQNSVTSVGSMGDRDVDGGKTTLTLQPVDLSSYANPTFTYNRWYVNNPPSGANPNDDWWTVQITNDGVNWKSVELTRTSDRSWRKMAFRVRDYVEPTSKIQLRFIASDSIRPGQVINGGSVVEAALDDLTLYDSDAYTTNVNQNRTVFFNGLKLFPNPSFGNLKLEFETSDGGDMEIAVSNLVGEILYSSTLQVEKGRQYVNLELSEWPSGIYLVSVSHHGAVNARKFSIQH